MRLSDPDITADEPTAPTAPTAPRPMALIARLWSEHRAFAIALLSGALLRALVQLSFPPAFIFSDGPTYLGLVDRLSPSPDRPVGYGFLLRGLSWITRDVTAVAVTQQLLGLATAVMIYALLRRWGVSARVSTLATVPVLFDGMQLVLEHSVLSDVLFDFLLVLGIAILAWHRTPSTAAAACAGVVLGLTAVTRLVGEPVVLAAVLFCLMASTSRRRRIVTSLAVCIAFMVPITAYATWYHHERGVWALAQFGGKALYMRTTTFVDCATISVPAYERELCPDQPLGERRDPTYYGWHDTTTLPALRPPPGISQNVALRDFAVSAIRSQPWDYLRTVLRDVGLNFAPVRIDHFEYNTASKWSFNAYVGYQSTDWTGPAYAAHGGAQPETRQPSANVLKVYGMVVYVWGPLLLALLVVALAGISARRPRSAPATRPLAVLTTTVALVLMVLPVATAEFTWRYQLPAVVLLPVAAALGWTRLRGTRQPGATATPSTD